MSARVTSMSWTDADIARLRELSAKNASALRAAAALNRSLSSVKQMARTHGLKLTGTRQMRAAIRALDQKGVFSVDH